MATNTNETVLTCALELLEQMFQSGQIEAARYLEMLSERAGKAEAALKEATEWRPMETAPCDGTPILIAYAADPTSKTWSRSGSVIVRPFRRAAHRDGQSYWQSEVAGYPLNKDAVIGWLPLPKEAGQ